LFLNIDSYFRFVFVPPILAPRFNFATLFGERRFFGTISIRIYLPAIFESSIQCWTTGCLWLPMLGSHKLSRPKEVAFDWIRIIDDTVRLGNEKCLEILAIRPKDLPDGELRLRFFPQDSSQAHGAS
jgi:hypothetical protein